MKNLKGNIEKKAKADIKKPEEKASDSHAQFRSDYLKAMAALCETNRAEFKAFSAATDRVIQEMKL